MNMLRRLWKRVSAENPRWVLITFALLFVLGSVYFFTVKVQGYNDSTQKISGDGRYYYAFVTSIVLDGDVDLSNQYANGKQLNPWGYRNTPTGKPANPFTVGPALMWAPFFVLAHGLSLVFEPAAKSADGYSELTQVVTLYSSFLYGFAAALLAYAMARRRYGPGAAVAGAFVGLVCGPILQYIIHQPSFAHAPSAFTVALLLYVWDRGRGDDATTRTWRGWLALGACVGLAMCARQQNLVFALPAVIEGARRLVHAGRARALDLRARLLLAAAPAAGALAAVVCFLPQMLVWKSIYGYALGVPQGASYMQWGEPAWSEVLFSGRNGLFVYAPLWLVAFFGLFALLRRERMTGIVLLATFVLATWVNGAVTDWWAIGSIGARRFDGLLVHATLGFAAVARTLVDAVERRPRLAGGVALALLCAWFGNCNFSFTDQFTRYGRLGEPDSRNSLDEYVGVLQRQGRKVWRWGNPIALPAALAYAWRTGAPAKTYDDVVGPYLLIGTAIMDFQDRPAKETGALVFASPKHARFLLEGFAAPRKAAVNDKDSSRLAVGPSARLLVPINVRGRIAVRLTGVGIAETTLRVLWNGAEVVPTTPLHAGQPIDLKFELSDTQATRGVNVVDFRHDGVAAGAEAALYTKMLLQSPP